MVLIRGIAVHLAFRANHMSIDNLMAMDSPFIRRSIHKESCSGCSIEDSLILLVDGCDLQLLLRIHGAHSFGVIA
jgi:hypothetical protein